MQDENIDFELQETEITGLRKHCFRHQNTKITGLSAGVFVLTRRKYQRQITAWPPIISPHNGMEMFVFMD